MIAINIIIESQPDNIDSISEYLVVPYKYARIDETGERARDSFD